MPEVGCVFQQSHQVLPYQFFIISDGRQPHELLKGGIQIDTGLVMFLPVQPVVIDVGNRSWHLDISHEQGFVIHAVVLIEFQLPVDDIGLERVMYYGQAIRKGQQSCQIRSILPVIRLPLNIIVWS